MTDGDGPSSPRIEWTDSRDKLISNLPADLAAEATRLRPPGRGQERKMWIALASLWVSSPPEAREVLMEFVDKAMRDAGARSPVNLYERFATAATKERTP